MHREGSSGDLLPSTTFDLVPNELCVSIEGVEIPNNGGILATLSSTGDRRARNRLESPESESSEKRETSSVVASSRAAEWPAVSLTAVELLKAASQVAPPVRDEERL